jgi:deoxyadenosine/deoxycytidine kinase
MDGHGQVGHVPYIVVSGNTGTGKSSLLRRLTAEQPLAAWRSEVVDERQFHHPLLRNMFSDPRTWAYPIQLNFVIQRAMRLLGAAAGHWKSPLLMERCLAEDALFFDYYRARGLLPPSTENAYRSIHRCFVNSTRRPDLTIHLRSRVDAICRRLEAAFAGGERLEELRGSELHEYVAEMNQRYDRWAAIAPAGCGVYVEIAVDELPASDVCREARMAVLSMKEGRE